jgi:hypothetical protein
MKISDSPYRCGQHGFYFPDFDRKIDDHDCPRVLCEECEKESYDVEINQRPRKVKYFYEDKEVVVLQEAHNGSAVWKFDPPVIYPEWSFAEDLTPIIPDTALTSEEIMERMEELLPEVERLCKASGIDMPDPRDLLIMPGKNLRLGETS